MRAWAFRLRLWQQTLRLLSSKPLQACLKPAKEKGLCRQISAIPSEFGQKRKGRNNWSRNKKANVQIVASRKRLMKHKDIIKNGMLMAAGLFLKTMLRSAKNVM